MCKRFTPLSHNEAQGILDAFTEGKPIRLPDKDINDAKHDTFPGKTSPVFLSDGKGGLVLMEATWGFPAADGKKLIFNTRLDAALRHLASGEGMWSKAIGQGRCLVPTRAFYENHKTDKRYSDKSGKLVKQQYRVSLNGTKAFFMAGVFQDGRFSIVTTTPNSTMHQFTTECRWFWGPVNQAFGWGRISPCWLIEVDFVCSLNPTRISEHA